MRSRGAFSLVVLTALSVPSAAAQTSPSYARDHVYGPGNRLVATLEPDGYAPSAPTNLTASPDFCQVYLSWDPADDVGTGVSYYRVFRGTGSRGTTTGTTFTDIGGTRSATYTYTVKATDGVGNVGPASNSVTVKYPGCVLSPVPPTSLFLLSRFRPDWKPISLFGFPATHQKSQGLIRRVDWLWEPGQLTLFWQARPGAGGGP